MFQLSKEEFEHWKSQVVISNTGDKMGLRKMPYAFTEHGVAMLSSVLRSEQAIEVNIAIMRAFSKLRRILLENRELAVKLNNLERKYDKQFKVVFDAIRELMEPDVQNTTRKIGFHRE
jgi:CRISPR/Cas system-associated endonuclease Cas3-HD